MRRGAPVAGTGKKKLVGNSDINRLVRQVRRQQAEIQYSGHGILVWHPSGRGPVFLTSTKSGSQRTVKNKRAELRQIGFTL